MATKTKTSEASAPAPEGSVEQVFSEGLSRLDGGDLVAAAKAFTYVQEEAVRQDRLNLVRTARSYLAAIQARMEEKGEASKESSEMAAQMLLNRKDPGGALAKVAAGLQAAPDRAALHYLKALAHAQLGQGQESADALARAVELDPDLLFQFRLEPDFEAVRHSAPFATLMRS
jgi:tetratricopeptide (TPR) repeat protein